MAVKSSIKKKYNTFAIFAVFSICVAAGLLINLTNAAPRGKGGSTTTTNGPSFGLYINPFTASVQAGTKVTSTVSANLADNPVQSISVYLHYDPNVLRLDSIDQTGVDPGYSVSTRCSALDGCKQPGEIVLIVGYTGTGTIQPKNGLLLGALKFTTLKTGTTSVTIDPDTRLSGFASPATSQSVLDKRVISNSTISITKKKGR